MFESTDFQTSLMRLRLGHVEPSRHGKRVQDNDLGGNERAKRPRLETPSILDLIPQVRAYHPVRVSVTHRF